MMFGGWRIGRVGFGWRFGFEQWKRRVGEVAVYAFLRRWHDCRFKEEQNCVRQGVLSVLIWLA
jgi:hypothetical protein